MTSTVSITLLITYTSIKKELMFGRIYNIPFGLKVQVRQLFFAVGDKADEICVGYLIKKTETLGKAFEPQQMFENPDEMRISYGVKFIF